MAGDWIKIYRKLADSAVFDDPIALKVWISLLIDANFADRTLLTGQVIRRGELIIGQDKYAAKLKLTRQQLRTAIDKLEKCKNLTRKATSLGTHITICKYSTYQSTDFENNQ